VNPLLFLLILAAVITLALVACVRAFTESGRERLVWVGIVAIIALITLGSLVIG
jgi:hypothetical protein